MHQVSNVAEPLLHRCMSPPHSPAAHSNCGCFQDAHEFLNYLLNECSELLEKEAKAKANRAAGPTKLANGATPPNGSTMQPPTWIHELFQVRQWACQLLI